MKNEIKIYYRECLKNADDFCNDGTAQITYNDNSKKWEIYGAINGSADSLFDLTKGFFAMTEKEIGDLFNGEVIKKVDSNFTKFLSIKDFDDDDFSFNTVENCIDYAKIVLPFYIELIYDGNAELRYVLIDHKNNKTLGFADSISGAKALIEKVRALVEKAEVHHEQ